MSIFSQAKWVMRRYLPASTVKTLKGGVARITLRLPLMPIHDLEALASVHGAEKEKQFLELYATFFRPFKNRRVNLLEIGIGGAGNPNKGGGSLRMWAGYFRRGRIFGVDLHDKTPHDKPGRITTFQGHQADSRFLSRILEDIGRPDLVIDDGSHRNADVIQTFDFLFPRLAADGIYVIEDVQTSYWPAYGGSSEHLDMPDTTMGKLKKLADGLNYQELEVADHKPSYMDENVVGIYFGHNIVFIFKGDNTAGSNVLGKRW